jgi:hypothetical protein
VMRKALIFERIWREPPRNSCTSGTLDMSIPSLEKKGDMNSCLDDSKRSAMVGRFSLSMKNWLLNMWQRLQGSHALESKVQTNCIDDTINELLRKLGASTDTAHFNALKLFTTVKGSETHRTICTWAKLRMRHCL